MCNCAWILFNVLRPVATPMKMMATPLGVATHRLGTADLEVEVYDFSIRSKKRTKNNKKNIKYFVYLTDGMNCMPMIMPNDMPRVFGIIVNFVQWLNQWFPTCGSRPHVGSPSILIGVATGRQILQKNSYTFAIHNVRSCLCQKFCSVKFSPSNTGFNEIKASSTVALVKNYFKLLSY